MKRGPKLKLTPETQGKICLALKGGNFRSTAAQWAGVGMSAFCEWMRRGKASPKSVYGVFRKAVIEAEKGAEILAVGHIIRAAAKDPRHAEWWLSHRFPEKWADKARMEMRHRVKMEKQQGEPELTEEELRALDAVYERARLRAQAGADVEADKATH